MKHLEINKKCDRKSCFLARSKTLFIENNNFTKLRKGYKKREICSYPFSLSFFPFILFSSALFWFLLVLLALFAQDKFFFYIKLTQQGDDCVFKDFYAISFYDAQHVPWTNNSHSFHHSTGGFQAAKRRVMGIRLESLQEASYLRSQLCQIVNDASCCLVGATKYMS